MFVIYQSLEQAIYQIWNICKCPASTKQIWPTPRADSIVQSVYKALHLRQQYVYSMHITSDIQQSTFQWHVMPDITSTQLKNMMKQGHDQEYQPNLSKNIRHVSMSSNT